MELMQGIQMKEFGGPEVLVLREMKKPSPKYGEVLVKLEYAGAGFGDTYMRRGYYKPPHTYETHLPYTPGIDGVGYVAEIGEGVIGFEVGDHVTYSLGHASYAQYVAVPAWKLVRVPIDIPAPRACAMMITGLTAYYLSHLLYPLGPNDRCLIHAGAGSVGQTLIQIAVSKGARVLTTVGSQEKEEIVRKLGASVVIQYRQVDFVEKVREATGGKGVDVVYDSVGLETYRGSMKCLRPRGICALYGAASGIPDCVRPMEDLAENGSIFVTRSHLAHYITNANELQIASSSLFDLYRSGALKMSLDPTTFTLAQAADAHRYLEARATTGKVLLKVT
jgi:NADPH2:quinone reductase